MPGTKLHFVLDGFLVALIVSVCLPQLAFAYIDPGMGSIVWQVLLAGLLTLMVLSRRYWGRVKTLLHIGSAGKPSDPGDDD